MAATHQLCGLGHHHMTQIVAGGQDGLKQTEPLWRGDQYAHVAVMQNKGHLIWLEQGVHWHKHSACSRTAKACDHRFKAFFEVDGHPFSTRQAQIYQARGTSIHSRMQFTIVHVNVTIGERMHMRGARGSE